MVLADPWIRLHAPKAHADQDLVANPCILYNRNVKFFFVTHFEDLNRCNLSWEF